MKLLPLKPGGPYEMTITGRNKIAIENVMVGEVWVCAGQSNMAWPLRNAKDAQSAKLAAAQYPKIRVFALANNASPNARRIAMENGSVRSLEGRRFFRGRLLFSAVKFSIRRKSPWG